MVMYTPIPLEFIFDEEEHGSHKKKRRTLDVSGVTLEVEQSSDSEFEIVKLISSNPAHYLDSRFQPGNRIALEPRWN